MGSYTSSIYSGKGSSSSSSSFGSSDTTLDKVIGLLQKVSLANKKYEEKKSELAAAKMDLENMQNEALREISKLDPSVVSTISNLFSGLGLTDKMILSSMDEPENDL